jgi:hypothetical protein
MMQSYEETLQYIHTVQPALIYLSIGCANAAEQQFPPQVKDWPGHKLCILIDPRLESPPLAFPDYPHSRNAYTYDDINTTVVPMAAHFYWPCYLTRGYDVCDAEVEKHIDFLEKLIVLTTAALPDTHLIVQDYSGTDIRPYYPLDKFERPTLCRRVLFDMTYGDGCCFVDFSKAHIYRNPGSNDFIQPLYERLTHLPVPPDMLHTLMESRHRLVNYYLMPFYRIQRGWAESRDWCTADKVFAQTCTLFAVYSLPVTTNNVRTLIATVLHDSIVAAGKATSHDLIEEILEDPDMKRITNELSLIRQSIKPSNPTS